MTGVWDCGRSAFKHPCVCEPHQKTLISMPEGKLEMRKYNICILTINKYMFWKLWHNDANHYWLVWNCQHIFDIFMLPRVLWEENLSLTPCHQCWAPQISFIIFSSMFTSLRYFMSLLCSIWIWVFLFQNSQCQKSGIVSTVRMPFNHT